MKNRKRNANKRISRAAVIIVAAIYCLTLTGCNKTVPKESTEEDGKLKVIATMYASYDFARQVAGDNISLTMLMKPGTETHSFEPTPKEIIDIQNCDVFIYTGGENDEWVGGILETAGNKDMKVVKLLECVDAVEEEIVEGMESDDHDAEDHEAGEHDHDAEDHEAGDHEAEDHEAGDHDYDAEDHEAGEHDHDAEDHEAGDHDYDAEDHVTEDHDHDAEDHEADGKNGHDHVHGEETEWDEHVWTSPLNAIKIAEKLAAVFSEADSTNSTIYKANLEAYRNKLTDLDKEIRAIVGSAKRKVLVFGDRFPIRYFVEEYGIEYFAAFPGCSSDTEASAATITFLIDKVRTEGIPVVFKIELSNGNIADIISEATGAKIMTFYSCHNVMKEDFEAGISYIDFMNRNKEALREALN